MTSLRGIVLLRDEDKTLPMESKSLSKNLNLTALPARGEGEKSVVSYQTYGSNNMRSMISERVR